MSEDILKRPRLRNARVGISGRLYSAGLVLDKHVAIIPDNV